jgi:hypothetical protein
MLAHGLTYRASLAITLLAAASCTPTPPPDSDGGASESSADTSTGDPGTTLPMPPDPSVTSTTSVSDTTGSTGDDPDSTGVEFIAPPDVTHPGFACDLEAQDCPPGHKCMPYDSDGSGWWDATACFPVHREPVGLGEPCEWEGMPWSGQDDCGFAQVCWSFEDGDGGVCKGLCLFEDPEEPWNPSCEDPAAIPYYGCQECFCTCETQCDPLIQGCARGQACTSTGDIFSCVPDASGDMGAYGDECEFINVCDPGLACVPAELVPGCGSVTGCCSPFCDVTEPNACPGAAEGQTCQPWYEPGTAPRGLENVGVCALPQ